ncbi:AraC family transcriptional regulator [Bittarella massiliensis (ex Durand et al. 2017)]|uniref:AraC family transcriptional regulator n=1 Tax=Bittarella massiliensis (ex Durand et al. 2017) TaxID=1720313 RepID=UPI001AA19ABC|nr:AraC family transcriptional regulator [Bittarella massiliensis (ex Durand et al. 2017)]MBO1679667.1 helix-turn-helix transcriptional regulator [Bittarella massiliensis (ex Durand et al. 2017)]
MNSAQNLAAEAVAIIEGELQRRIPLAELAERLHYSPYYLQRAFVGAVGLPPARYAQRRRLTEGGAAAVLHPPAFGGDRPGGGV